MYEEEGTWFIEIKKKGIAADQAKVSKRYEEEFDSYVGDDLDTLSDKRYAITAT